ncbi:hypothetical protein [Haloparvum sedimenti]|uniref:hypothetical protein n=1 Tax=Haloparvum sedimenti TaxID=1678448 RepID=UPI000B336BC4|nr:hypothetical protein [Haloparvum sedimenti]
MPIDATAGFDKLADMRFNKEAAAVVGGLLVGEASGYMIDGTTVFGVDLPPELGGVLVIGGAEYAPAVSGRVKREVQIGGASAVALSLLERFGVRDALTEAVA